MNFEDSVELILRLEGGYANDPNDPGGETKYGISKRAYPNEDIKNLTVRRAKEIYHSDYWNPTAGRIYDTAPNFATLLFDTAVNMGTGHAAQALQGLVHTTQDGVIGAKTLAALQSVVDARGESWVIEQYAAQRMQRYTRLTGWQHYANGWTIRLFTVVLAVGHGAGREDTPMSLPPSDDSAYRAAVAQIKALLEPL